MPGIPKKYSVVYTNIIEYHLVLFATEKANNILRSFRRSLAWYDANLYCLLERRNQCVQR